MPALKLKSNQLFAYTAALRCREAKKCKAYDMYQLLARMITFRQNIGQLLAAVHKHLPDASQPKVYNKLSVLLQHASRGIHANATASPQDLMVFIHGVLDGGLAGEEAAREAAQAEATAAVHTSSECSFLHALEDCTLYTVYHNAAYYVCLPFVQAVSVLLVMHLKTVHHMFCITMLRIICVCTHITKLLHVAPVSCRSGCSTGS